MEGTLALIALFGIMATAMGLLFNIKLGTRIDKKGIHYKYVPSVKWRLIEKREIREAGVIPCNPPTDYTGWGIREKKTTKANNAIGSSDSLSGQGKKI